MSAEKRMRKPRKNINQSTLRYAEMLEAVGRHRITQFVPYNYRLQENLAIGNGTQEKLMSIVAIMDGIGKLPGDLSKMKFDKPITYSILNLKTIEWLEKCGVPSRRITPLASYSYGNLFAPKGNCLVEEKNIEKFFSHFIHCLLVETEIILSRQYYHGLGLYKHEVPIVDFLSKFPSEIQEIFSRPQLNQISVDQLHGKIFVDYCVVMIRAQWDKLISLSCLVFGLRQNWDTVSDGIKALKDEISNSKDLHPLCKYGFDVFLYIIDDRVKPDSWLKTYRDSLIHNVGQHSSGVAPHKKSLRTTSEFWDQVCEEHNALREGMIALISAFALKNSPLVNQTNG